MRYLKTVFIQLMPKQIMRSVSSMRRQKKKQRSHFFYIWPITLLITPYIPKEEVMKYRGKYKDGWTELHKKRYARQIEMGLIKKDWALSPTPKNVRSWDSLNDKEKDWEDQNGRVRGMVDRLDQGIGRLVKTLKEKDVYENILMFCSDNGACPFERTRGAEKMPWDPESYWTYDTGWAHAGNTPFRWYKQNQHEGGISSPLIVHWPGIDLRKVQYLIASGIWSILCLLAWNWLVRITLEKAKLMGKSFVSTLRKSLSSPMNFYIFTLVITGLLGRVNGK